MFLCDKCLKENYFIQTQSGYVEAYKVWVGTFMSVGPCEDCHEVGPCYDIASGRYAHKESFFAHENGLVWTPEEESKDAK